MAVYTEEITTEYTFPNITLYKKLRDGEHYAWRIHPNEGYVMYDTTDEKTEFQPDPETGEDIEVPVTHYYTVAHLPLKYDFDNFPWVAVPREDVEDEGNIF